MLERNFGLQLLNFGPDVALFIAYSIQPEVDRHCNRQDGEPDTDGGGEGDVAETPGLLSRRSRRFARLLD